MSERGGVQIQVMGPIQVVDESGDVVTLSPQLKRLVGLLVVADGAPVSASRLAEYVADGNSEGSTVRTAVSRLRKVLGNDIEAADGGYRLRGEGHEIDLHRFEELRTASGPDRVSSLTEALELFRGRPFGDLADEEWAINDAGRLESQRAATTEDLAEALVDDSRFNAAIELLEPHVVEHPYRERPVGLLMRALAADGRTADALRSFQRFRAVLRDDVGLEPSSELRELEASILTATDEARPRPQTPVVTAAASLPDGTVTFMFTDIESSTQRWQADEAKMSAELGEHDRLLDRVASEHGGVVFKHTGDGVCAVFTSATSAVDAAIAAQHDLQLPVRIGIHTGEAERRGHDYFGPTLNRVARVMDAGHGGQILVSAATASLVAHDLTDLGRHRLKGLASPEQIFQVGTDEFPPLRVERDRKGNLPTDASSFIGRDADIDTIAERVARDHVVTLLGVGGTGKTRLSMEVARVLAPTFPDGCWFAELATINIPEAVPFAIAQGLGISPPSAGDIVDHVIGRIRHQRLLLIVDNCEHLLSSTADAVERIGAACPAVTVLTTSREPLMINGESLCPVPSLTESDAVELFVARAATEAPDLLLDETQLVAIAELCERLDRLPLAIELAASRLRSLTPVELLGSIDERLRLLVGGRRSRMERHQTMRGTLDWSYDLCTPVEQDVFDRLSVFPTTFDLTAARAVGSGGVADELDVIDTVPRLVDRSLLQRATAEDGTSRYRMLETMRAYGREHLQHAETSEEVRERHALHVADTLRRLGLRMFGPDEHAVTSEMAGWLTDSVVAASWLAEHERWDEASQVCLAGYATGFRQWTEIAGLVIDAARHAGLGDIDFIRLGLQEGEVDSATEQIALEMILQRAWAPPPDRYVLPPHFWLEDLEMTRDECEQLVASLAELDRAPQRVTVAALFFTAYAMVVRGHLDLAEQVTHDLERLADEFDSRIAGSYAANLRSMITAERCEWEAAARTSEAALAFVRDSTTAGAEWVAVAIGFRLLRTRTLAGLPIRSTDIREPWGRIMLGNITAQTWHGAFSTAIALTQLGEHELAVRFLVWLRHDLETNGRVDISHFGDSVQVAFAAVGLDWERDSTGSGTDTLDDLVAEALAIADTLPDHDTPT